MEGPPVGAQARERGLLAMVHAVASSLPAADSVHETVAAITDAAHALLDFEHVEILHAEGANGLRVRVPARGVAWMDEEGRLLRIADSSAGLWADLQETGAEGDAVRRLDPSFPLDREILDRGTRSMLRVRLDGCSRSFGTLSFSHSRVDAFDDRDERVAAAIAGLVTMALEHAGLLADGAQTGTPPRGTRCSPASTLGDR